LAVATFLIGSHDTQTSTVAGYLDRPIYNLECECRAIVWNGKRQSLLPPEEFGRRLAEAVALAGQHDAILIRNRPVTLEDLTSSTPTLSVALLKSFTDAPTDENFWIYRVSENVHRNVEVVLLVLVKYNQGKMVVARNSMLFQPRVDRAKCPTARDRAHLEDK